LKSLSNAGDEDTSDYISLAMRSHPALGLARIILLRHSG
jgi:hypothetical protein